MDQEEAKNYQMIKLMNGTLLIGQIVANHKTELVVEMPLQLKTVARTTSFGVKDDSTLTPWIPFTDDKRLSIPTDKIISVVNANADISNYYEVILDKLNKPKEAVQQLSPKDISKILEIADELDRQDRGEEYDEEDVNHLINSTKTVH